MKILSENEFGELGIDFFDIVLNELTNEKLRNLANKKIKLKINKLLKERDKSLVFIKNKTMNMIQKLNTIRPRFE